MNVTLSLTHRCNLACRYCYAGQAFKRDMSLETARKAVNFALRITPPGEKIEFGFFGGEPLLCFEQMGAIIAYIREQVQDSSHPVRFSITTNGTMLTQPMLDFLKAEQIDLCISLDGPPHVHDLNRCYFNGRGSCADVVKNLKKALTQLKSVQVNAVYGPETVAYLPETVAFLVEMGTAVIHLNPNIGADWDGITTDHLQDAFMKVADYYIHCYQQGQEIAINMIDSKIILFMKGGYSIEDLCGMGETQWAFAPSGNIYPCERFIGEDDDDTLRLGNLYTGFDRIRQCGLLEKKANRNKACQTCGLNQYCMNWCGCTNYYMTGRINLAGSLLCNMEKAAIHAARHVSATLSESGNQLFVDHFMRYLHDEPSSTVIDSL